MKHTLVFLVTIVLQLSCTDAFVGPQDRRFDILMKYGIGARNELNTFDNTFTKDLILDGTVTTRLILSQADFDSIESRLMSIDIFSYPDTFLTQHTDTVAFFTPHPTYGLKMKRGSSWKDLFWEDSIISSDARATRLRQALEFIRTLVEAKPEYKRLPPARGGYD